MKIGAPQNVAARVRRAAHDLLHLAASWVEPRAPADLEQRLARGDVVWRAFLDAGRALVEARRFDEADGALHRALAAFPGDGDLLVEYAMSAHNSGRYGLAVDRWTVALAAAPDVAMCHAGLAANRRMMGDNDGATSVIDPALDRFPGDLLIVTEAARCAEQRGASETALALWETACATSDPHPEWLRGRAHAFVTLGRFNEAQAVLTAALKRHPDDRPLRLTQDLLSARDVASRRPAQHPDRLSAGPNP